MAVESIIVIALFCIYIVLDVIGMRNKAKQQKASDKYTKVFAEQVTKTFEEIVRNSRTIMKRMDEFRGNAIIFPEGYPEMQLKAEEEKVDKSVKQNLQTFANTLLYVKDEFATSKVEKEAIDTVITKIKEHYGKSIRQDN